MKNKFILLILCLTYFLNTNAQYSVFGGFNTLKPFGNSSPYLGFHLGLEIPSDDENSLYGKFSFYAKNKLDPSVYGAPSLTLENLDQTDFSIQNVSGATYFNYTTIDGGRRYYILDGYDSGFSLYGGSNIMAIINRASVKLDAFDKAKYRLPAGFSSSGTVLNLGIGLSGGAKYTIAGVGSIFCDATFNYLIIGNICSNELAKAVVATNVNSPIVFTFNIGFRKDFY